MKVRVYHNPDDVFDFTSIEDMIAVADVECDDIEHAMELTMSIDDDWWKNSGVTKLFEDETCRSTNTGDAIVNLDTNKIHVVELLGFRTIESDVIFTGKE
jgi:hypothetical protein